MPKRFSKNQPKAKLKAPAQAVESRQSDDPQSEFSVPQKWKENAESDADTGSSNAANGKPGPVIEGSESADRA